MTETAFLEGNDASAGLLESLGFEREGVHRDEVYAGGEYMDLYTYGLLAEEY
jgi:RimJ/RimL family protein N-acetyltransferase